MHKVEQCSIISLTGNDRKVSFSYHLPHSSTFPVDDGYEPAEKRTKLNDPGKPIQVCREVYAGVYGFKLTTFKKAIKQFKLAPIPSASVRIAPCIPWKDNHIHNFSYNETVSLARDNFIDLSMTQIRYFIFRHDEYYNK
jgi:hypothetical protein